jgi:RecB family exonuclease
MELIKLHFGWEFDEQVYPGPATADAQTRFVGPEKCLGLLEQYMGLFFSQRNAFLRVEAYRQNLRKHLALEPDAFFARSFEADPLASAKLLLAYRDELVLSTWNFEPEGDMPPRLLSLAAVEQISRDDVSLSLPDGFADRFIRVEQELSLHELPIEAIVLNEAIDFYPPHWQRMFQKLAAKGIQLSIMADEIPNPTSDLDYFKAYVNKALPKDFKPSVKGDESIVVLRAARESAAAGWLAKALLDSPDFNPLLLVPDKDRAVDVALYQESLPSLGIQSASLARPTQQLLKLIPTFLWNPVDPHKMLEFVSLPQKPLDNNLAYAIATAIADKPGMNSDVWIARVYGFLRNLEDEAKEDAAKVKAFKAIEAQYNFWFRRRRHAAKSAIPVTEVAEVYQYLRSWALEQANSLELDKKRTESERRKVIIKKQQQAMQVLADQSDRVVKLLLSLPDDETRISNLQLERIIRMVYEPSSVKFREEELDHLPVIHRTGALSGKTNNLVWWNFVDKGSQVSASKWYSDELSWLQARGCTFENSQTQADRMLWLRIMPINRCSQRMVLVIPESIVGQAVNPHPLLGDLYACFGEDAVNHQLSFTIDEHGAKQPTFLQSPKHEQLALQLLSPPEPWLQIPDTTLFKPREEESYSSLSQIFYYPYQWVFRHQAQIKAISTLQITKESTLLGNLAHKLFEMMFKERLDWDKDSLLAWIDANIDGLLEREGSILLLYGREPERASFVQRMKRSAWTLIYALQSDGWTVKATEQELSGHFADTKIKGYADLVLENAKGELAILDLKWSGKTYRSKEIKQKEDLQLCIYSRLVQGGMGWAHTAYFLIESGTILARNNLAFSSAVAVSPDDDPVLVYQELWQKMERTYRWRMAQIKAGKIEIRTEHTIKRLDEAGDLAIEEMLQLLDMKRESSRYDDYSVLVQ